MRFRSPTRVLLLSLFTLGIYDLIWVMQNERDMKTRGVNTPKTIYFVFLRLATMVWLVFVLSLAWSWLFVDGPNLEISKTCRSEYIVNQDQGTSANDPISQKCEADVADSNVAEEYQQQQLRQAIILIVTGAILSYATSKWLRAYAKAIAVASKTQLSSTAIALLLMSIPSASGISLVQKTINRSSRK